MISSGVLPLAAAGDRDDVVEAHHDVGDRHDLHGRPWDAPPRPRRPRPRKRSGTSNFAAITSNANPPTSLRNGRGPSASPTMPVKMSCAGKRATPAPRRPCPISAGAAASPGTLGRDDKRVVTRQQDVDPHDLAERDPESGLLHLGLELGEECRDRCRIEDLPDASSQRFLPPAYSAGLGARHTVPLPLSDLDLADDFVARKELLRFRSQPVSFVRPNP